MCSYLSLILVGLSGQVASSSPANKKIADGKVFITGDHNEVVVSTARETKKALAEIESKINSLNENDKKFADLMNDLMNKSNTALSVQVQAMSKRLTTFEKRGTYAVQFYSLVIEPGNRFSMLNLLFH